LDPFTHALSGAVTARALPRTGDPDKRFGPRECLLLGAAAALWPDIDWVIQLFADELVYLNLHRGVTHSLVMLPIWALILGPIVARLWPADRDWRQASLIIGAGIGIHILGDFITSYGTQLFAPLSSQKLAFPSTFIIDPWITLILFSGLIVLWRGGGRRAACLTLVAVIALVLFQGAMKLRALDHGQSQAEALGLSVNRVHALPQPFSPLHWRLILEGREGHWEAHLGFLRQTGSREPGGWPLSRHWRSFYPPHALEWAYYPRLGPEEGQAFARTAWWRPEFAEFRRFAGLPYLWAIEEQAGRRCAIFTDLRFRTEGMPPPFRFAMCRDDAGQWTRERWGRW